MERPPLWEFVFLSMLIHVIAIALFGAPSGGTSEGRAMWGALQVVLQGASLDTGPKLKMEHGLGVEQPAAPKKLSRPAPRKEPQRAEPAAPLLKPEPHIETLALPVEAPPAPLSPMDVPPIVVPPLLDRIVTPERPLELPEFRIPPPTPVQAAPSPPPAPAAAELPAVVERPAPRVERAPAEEPPIPAPVVQPRIERAPVETPPVAAPIVQPLLPPLPERAASPPLAKPPVITPVVPAVPTPPVESPPVEVPVIPALAPESIGPSRAEPATKALAPPEVPAAPAPAPAPVQQREAPAKIERAPALREEPALSPSPFRTPGPSSDSIRNNERAPSSSYDPTAPAVDLDSIRKRAGELARSGSGQRAILAFPMPPVPPKKSKLEDALDKAHKPDCRTAYSSLGLAAVVPLIANEFGEGTCKW